MSEITRNDWLAALHEAGIDTVGQADDPTALTVIEVAKLLGCADDAARRHANRLVETGRATATFKRVVDNLGRVRAVRAYRLQKGSSDAAPSREP